MSWWLAANTIKVCGGCGAEVDSFDGEPDGPQRYIVLHVPVTSS